MLIPSMHLEDHLEWTSLSRRVNANSQQRFRALRATLQAYQEG